ncbi:MAG: NERD domain-containing protein [Candidatus Heimdallarchaeaceae archaeon]
MSQKRHDEILLNWQKDLEKDGYIALKNLCYPEHRYALGEIDILAFKDGYIYLFEIKSGNGSFRKGINQLRKAEDYLGAKCEKYLIMKDEEIYYLE